MNIEIANRLAELRRARGLSQEQLAEQLNISRQAVSKWERAESSPDTDNLIALARLYGTSLDELVALSPEAAQDEAFARDHAPSPVEAGGDHEQWFRFQRPDGGVNLLLFPYPVLVTLLYLLMGLFMDLWHPAWLLFMTVPMYYTAIDGGHINLNRIPYPLLVTTLYLVTGFAFDWWHPGWILFMTIPVYYTLLGKKLQDNVNLWVMAVGLTAMFSLLGFMLWQSYAGWMAAVGVALVALGVWSTLDR